MDTKGEISAWEINTTYPTVDMCFSREYLLATVRIILNQVLLRCVAKIRLVNFT